MMSQWCPCQFMIFYHQGMWFIWIEWLCIPGRTNLLISLLHYLNIIVQSTKLTVHLRYDNQLMSQHIQKTIEMRILGFFFQCTMYSKYGNWNESIMLIFYHCWWPKHFLSCVIPLVAFFFARSFCFGLIYFFTSCTFGCDARWSDLCWPEALCAPFLTFTILVGQLNKIFSLINQTIKRLHGLYCIIFKNMCFWCGTKYKLTSGLHGGIKKRSCLSDPLTW